MLHVGVDVGGTFTDAIIYDDADQTLVIRKIPTTHNRLEDAILASIGEVNNRPNQVNHVSHATTIATNALLTRSGLARCALITNKGFRDVLEIGRQRRPDLYDLEAKRPTPLVPRKYRFTVRGRILYNGLELEPLSIADVKKIARGIQREKFDAVAIGFLNSYVNSKHETRARTVLRQEGFRGQIILSSEVNREYREFERFSTTAVNAVLSPLISKYLSNLENELRKQKILAPLYVMNSAGGVSTAKFASNFPVFMIESGPAAGVLASKHLARAYSLEKVLTFDMGGTTAKAGAVTNYEADVAYEFEAAGKTHSGRSVKGSGYAVRAPFIDLAEVSAGGGTIAWVDEAGALQIGPESAGSEPGPAAYGRGGTRATITDANVVLGRLSSQFLLGGEMKIDPKLARQSIEGNVAKKLGMTTEEAAQGIIRLVNNTMAKAISIVSIERGRDPREYALIAFGGAGPIHACDLAEELEIRRIIIPEHAGMFSARGLLSADIERTFSLFVMKDLEKAKLEIYFSKLRDLATKTLTRDGFYKFKTTEVIGARYKGQSYQIQVPVEKGDNNATIREQFDFRHKKLYGYDSQDKIEIVAAHLRSIIEISKPSPNVKSGARGSQNQDTHKRRASFSGTFYNVRVYSHESLVANQKGKGPCIIEEYDSTALINPHWSWQIDSNRNLFLKYQGE